VGAEPQPADPLRDCGLRRADEDAEAGDRAADLLEELPALWSQHRDVEQERVELHRDQLFDGNAAGEHAVLQAGPLEPLAQNGEEGRVGVDHSQPDSCLIAHRALSRTGSPTPGMLVRVRDPGACMIRGGAARTSVGSGGFTGFSQANGAFLADPSYPD